MAIYSHSKLSTFEQCKFKYKLRYIDKIKPTIERSIEAHLGTCVHDSLEWLYREVLNGKTPELDGLIEKYTNKWQEEYKETFLIVRKENEPEYYFNLGIKFLVDYHLKNKPFDDGTLETEKRVWVTLHPGSRHKIIGYIDRLVYNKEKDEYEIHDYKTSGTIPPQEKLEKDRQLALYSIAIKETYGKGKPILLTWHYLSQNMQVFSRRTDEQLDNLKNEILTLIEEIEQTKEFPTNESPLCQWCEYKSMCPVFGGSPPKKIEKQAPLNLGNVKKDFPTTSKYIQD